jgi:hypothetical protein
MMSKEITRSVAQILVDDSNEVLDGLCRASNVPMPTDLDGTGNTNLASIAKAILPSDGVLMDLSDIALNSENRVGMIPLTELQSTAQVICGCEDAILLGVDFINSFASWPEADRLYRASFAVDVCSMTDAMFGRGALDPRKAVKGYLREAQDRSLPGLIQLEAIGRNLPSFLEDLREIRNTIAAHVDAGIDPNAADSRLDALRVSEVLAFTANLYSVIRESWAMDTRIRAFLMHGQRLQGALGTETTDLITPYND